MRCAASSHELLRIQAPTTTINQKTGQAVACPAETLYEIFFGFASKASSAETPSSLPRHALRRLLARTPVNAGSDHYDKPKGGTGCCLSRRNIVRDFLRLRLESFVGGNTLLPCRAMRCAASSHELLRIQAPTTTINQKAGQAVACPAFWCTVRDSNSWPSVP